MKYENKKIVEIWYFNAFYRFATNNLQGRRKMKRCVCVWGGGHDLAQDFNFVEVNLLSAKLITVILESYLSCKI